MTVRDAGHAFAVSEFVRRKVQLRLSVSHACQLKCNFCHQEGIDSHWQPIFMDLDFFSNLVSAYVRLGGGEVNLTGGDPLTHPNITGLLAAAFSTGVPTSVCSNGMALTRAFSSIRAGHINRLKISFHSFDKDVYLLGTAWSPLHVLNNIRAAVGLGCKVTVNFTATKRNVAHLDRLLDLSESVGFDVLVIDVIGTRSGGGRPDYMLASYANVRDILVARSVSERLEGDRSGAIINHYTSPSGQDWMMKSVDMLGLNFTEMCNGCVKRATCGEGVFTLRVDSSGIFRPCLLRADLDFLCAAPHRYDIVYTDMLKAIDRMFPARNPEKCTTHGAI